MYISHAQDLDSVAPRTVIGDIVPSHRLFRFKYLEMLEIAI